MFNRRGLLAFFFASALLIFGLDQWSKLVVVESMELGDRIQVFEFFAWVRWHNYGAAFSLLADAGGWQRWFFVIVAVIFCVYLVLELSDSLCRQGMQPIQPPKEWLFLVFSEVHLGTSTTEF